MLDQKLLSRYQRLSQKATFIGLNRNEKRILIQPFEQLYPQLAYFATNSDTKYTFLRIFMCLDFKTMYLVKSRLQKMWGQQHQHLSVLANINYIFLLKSEDDQTNKVKIHYNRIKHCSQIIYPDIQNFKTIVQTLQSRFPRLIKINPYQRVDLSSFGRFYEKIEDLLDVYKGYEKTGSEEQERLLGNN